MGERIFHHTQGGPYGQSAAIWVSDDGNRLPIKMYFSNDDPPHGADNAMTIDQAMVFRDKLTKAIRRAKKAGLR